MALDWTPLFYISCIGNTLTESQCDANCKVDCIALGSAAGEWRVDLR
jgi:hypothetical protein